MENKIINIKQDINFLDKPLWFQNDRQEIASSIWTEIEGFEYHTSYKFPDKIDMVILFYLLYKSQKNDYCRTLKLKKFEILKECGFSTNTPYYYERLEESFERWKSVYIRFKGTFYDGNCYSDFLFGIIDDVKIKQDKQVIINFNENWLITIKESSFFKFINFEYYKSLKRPLSRRLYELLSKNFKDSNVCYFKLTNLGKKLTISPRKDKRGEKKYFASCILTKIEPAINEINKVASTPNIASKTGIRAEDLFSLSYEIKGENQDRIIYFYRHPILEKGCTKQTEIEKLLSLLKKITINLTAIIQEYYYKEGGEYVKANIEYSNKNSSKNYCNYVKRSLEENWAKYKKSFNQDFDGLELTNNEKEKYSEAMTWLTKTFKDLSQKAIEKMISPKEFLAYYPKFREEWERRGKEIENPSNFAMESFKYKWDFKELNKEIEKKEILKKDVHKKKEKINIKESLREFEFVQEKPKQNANESQQKKYISALNWINDIPYFHEDRKKEIAQLPVDYIVEIYPDIKKKYEELEASGKVPTPGWVYKAFKEGYRYEKKEKPEDKTKKLWEKWLSWSEDEKELFISDHMCQAFELIFETKSKEDFKNLVLYFMRLEN